MRRPLVAAAAVTVLLTAAVACSRSDGPEQALQAFLDGWPTGELDEVPFVTPTGTPVPSAEVAESITALAGDLAEQPPALTAGTVATSGDTATGEITIDWPLPGGATWSYPSTVRLAEGDGGWRVIWEPAVVHPGLVEGDELQLRRLPSTRGDILDGDGEPLVTARPVTDIGIWPSRVEDVSALVAGLDRAFESIGVALDETLAGLPDQIDDAREDDLWVDVVTLRRPDYQRIEADLAALPGVQTRDGERHLAPTRTFARALLGTVGPVFAEDVQEHPGVYEPGDRLGRGGLSQEYEEQLRGVVGQAVVIARQAPDDTVNDTELDRVEPVPGTDLRTTLDRRVQEAAEAALRADDRPAALVAVRVSDGAVLAVANTHGTRDQDLNLALTGAVPPGSTFKIVTGYALLAAGELTLDTDVDCPEEFTVDGFGVGNAFPGDRGRITFQQAVAISCNTAFAALAPRLGDDGLATAGAALGLGGDWDLGLPTFTGTVATGGSAFDQAQAAFGQGQTQVSTAAMAAAVAAVARGAWLPPALVVDPDPPDPAPLPEAVVADLHTALRSVVTGGTAEALRSVPGGDVFGKTGSAEAGDDVHGWFVGWQGDLAFAVFVEDGQSGSGAAVPLAGSFLDTLAG